MWREAKVPEAGRGALAVRPPRRGLSAEGSRGPHEEPWKSVSC